MTDRELLELAAKAAGHTLVRSRLHDPAMRDVVIQAPADSEQRLVGWNPLADDGDALRLAVKLNLLLGLEFARCLSLERFANQDKDDAFATRRAIVRAAAQIALQAA